MTLKLRRCGEASPSSIVSSRNCVELRSLSLAYDARVPLELDSAKPLRPIMERAFSFQLADCGEFSSIEEVTRQLFCDGYDFNTVSLTCEGRAAKALGSALQ